MSDGIVDASLCAIADRIAARQISAIEVTEAAIRRAEALQPTLNTVYFLNTRNHEHRDITLLHIRLESLKRLKAIHFRHFDIQQNQIK